VCPFAVVVCGVGGWVVVVYLVGWGWRVGGGCVVGVWWWWGGLGGGFSLCGVLVVVCGRFLCFVFSVLCLVGWEVLVGSGGWPCPRRGGGGEGLGGFGGERGGLGGGWVGWGGGGGAAIPVL